MTIPSYRGRSEDELRTIPFYGGRLKIGPKKSRCHRCRLELEPITIPFIGAG